MLEWMKYIAVGDMSIVKRPTTVYKPRQSSVVDYHVRKSYIPLNIRNPHLDHILLKKYYHKNQSKAVNAINGLCI